MVRNTNLEAAFAPVDAPWSVNGTWNSRILAEGRFAASPDELAERIEADARVLLARRQPVDLQRYLDAVPDLTGVPVALDAAIEFTLRSRVIAGMSEREAVGSLIREHPSLEHAIRECAMLDAAILSTTAMGLHALGGSRLDLPCEIGPVLPDGRPRYELFDMLGFGSTGVVYLAKDRNLSDHEADALVAVKLLREPLAAPLNPGAELDEATKARRIDHPNVIRVLDRGTLDGGAPFIVYEFVRGTDLGAWFEERGRRVSPKEAARLVRGIALGIQAAHRAGLVHCDLKPQNIIIDETGVPRVADFGLATRIGADVDSRYGYEDSPPGNLAFMAPERFRNEPGSLTPTSDVYAIGALLFYLLTGRLPNGSTADEIAATYDPANTTPSQPPSTFRRGIDRTLDRICARAMAADPAMRHDSAGQLAADLEAWCADRPVWSLRPSAFRVCRLWARRHPVAAGAAALAVAMGGVGGVAVLDARTEAERRRIDAALAEADLQRNEVKREEGRRTITAAAAMFKTMRAGRMDEEYIGLLHWMDTVFGSPFFDRDEADRLLWPERVGAARAIIAEGEPWGREDLRSLMWRTTLGLWLVSAGDDAEAEPLLAACLDSWAAILRKDDPMLAQVSLLRDAAAANRLAAEPPPRSDAWILERRELLERLATHESVFKGTLTDSNIHRLVRRSYANLSSLGQIGDDPHE